MRIGPRYDTVTERIGAALNLVPLPVGLSMFGMPVARALQIAQRVGVFGELVRGPASAAELAEALGLREQGARRLLDVLVTAGQLQLDTTSANLGATATSSQVLLSNGGAGSVAWKVSIGKARPAAAECDR